MNKQKGMAPILIIILIALAVGGYLLYQKQFKPAAVQLTTQSSPAPANARETANWKTYTNDQYGFQLNYPATGLINGGGVHIGGCGNAIKTESNPPADGISKIYIDNFLAIKIKDWNQSLEAYINQKDPKKLYEILPIAESNADEAIQVNGLKQGAIPQSMEDQGLAYIYSLYKKNGKLFILSGLQNPGNVGGCMAMSQADYTKYPQLKKYQLWESKSMKFQ